MAIAEAVERAGVVAAVAHVLRYTPYTRLVRRLLDEGAVGEVVSVEHLEPVGFFHHAHSYVRGNWRREDEAGPMLLAKCCHDLDWLSHVVGARCEAVSSFGSLGRLRPEAKPEGAADRCLDCAIEPGCPYSARRIYLEPAERGDDRLAGRRGRLAADARRTWSAPCATARTGAACGRATTTSSTTRWSRSPTRAARPRA